MYYREISVNLPTINELILKMQEVSNSSYIIGFKELKAGDYSFKFPVSAELFSPYEECEVLKGTGEVSIDMVRGESMLQLNVAISASVDVECDRCLDPVAMPISYDGMLIVKFSDDEELEGEDDGEVMWLPTSAAEVDLRHYIYESIILSLPYQRVHDDEQDCNPEMVKYLMQGDNLELAEQLDEQEQEQEEEALPPSEIAKLEALKRKMLGE